MFFQDMKFGMLITGLVLIGSVTIAAAIRIVDEQEEKHRGEMMISRMKMVLALNALFNHRRRHDCYLDSYFYISPSPYTFRYRFFKSRC